MRFGDEQPSGRHAVVAVGYQDSPSSPGGGYFILRNSWGITRAYESPYGAGYGTIPYQYISDDAWEAYSTEERGGDMAASRPVCRRQLNTDHRAPRRI
jgi:C1A family cysteine protease